MLVPRPVVASHLIASAMPAITSPLKASIITSIPRPQDGFDVPVDQPREHLDPRKTTGHFVAENPGSVYSGRATIASS